MIKNKLLQKYFLLAVIIVALFVVLGFFLTGFVARALRAQKDIKDQREVLPPIFLAKMVDNLNYKSKLEALQNLKSWRQDNRGPELVLINGQGQVIYPVDSNPIKEKIEAADLKKLDDPYDYYYLKESGEGSLTPPPPGLLPPGAGFMFGGPPPPRRPHEMGGPPPGQMRPPPQFNRIPVIRLAGEPRFYLAVMPPQFNEQMTTQEKLIPFLGVGSLILSLLIGIGVTLFLIYASVFKKIREADQVLSELQKGNLKARFKVIRKDEFGEAMLRFNKMADEIEKLVEQMKFVELARTKLLQELAHDLRTPIAAMKSLLETLESKESLLDSSTKKEIIGLSLRETNYFERLIEDLLLLSQVSEPHYGSAQQEDIILTDLLRDEVDDQSLRHKNEDRKITFTKDIQDSEFILPGNRVLLQRMLKNVFNNAVSFAKSSVQVHFKQNGNSCEIVIEDDGPGFSSEQLKFYGLRKMSRQVIREKGNQERISIGLGSVVIKKICELHRGELSVENIQDLTPSKTGARITLKFASSLFGPKA